MKDIFTVKKQFGWMEPGDTFELSDDNLYECKRTETFSNISEDGDSIAKTSMSFSVSKDYIEFLEKNGIVSHGSEKNTENTKSTKFKNVFDEIDNMLETYNEDLENIEKDMKDSPACMKVEKETVLRNLIKALDYLKSLKY